MDNTRSNTDHTDRTTDNTERFTVSEAAGILNTTAEAVRQRIRRGRLSSEKDSSGNVFVLLDPAEHEIQGDNTRSNTDRTDRTLDNTALIESQQNQIEHLREQLKVWQEEARRKDHIIAALTERIPAIEPPASSPADERESSVTASEERGDGDVPPGPGQQERLSWWRRLFGSSA